MLLRRSAPILRSCARGTTLRSFPARSFTPTTTTSVFARAASTHAHTGQAFDFDTLVDMQQKSCFTYGDRPFLGSKPMQGGPYEWVTYRQFGQMVDQCRAAMKQSGVTAGDKVAVISSNRVEWAVGAYGAFSLGASYVPMYEQQRVSECEYILKDSGAKLLLVSKETIYDKVQPLRSSLPGLKDVWCFDLDFHPRLKAQLDPAATPPTHPRPSDVATVIYTSGTTGVPKGVALSHRNLVADIQAMNEVVPHDALPEVRSLSFLPWAHCIGKNCELHNMMQRGGQVALAQDLSTIADNIQEVRPTILFAVPTLFKKVYDKMMAKISDSGVLTRALVHTALNVAERRRAVLQEGREPHALLEVQYRLLQKAVIDKLRQPLGGKLQISPVGGSAMNVEVARFFENIGVGILEGYGLTETSPLLTINGFQVRDRRMGTVGRPIPGAEVAIVTEDGHRVQDGQEGEIWAAGPMVFSGYHNKPQETEMAFGELDGKRWFKTGDLGKFIKGGFLKITGRVKELYKLENGKYVAPAVVEKALLENSLVTQVLLYGANRPYNIALIYPNWDKLRQLALERKVAGVHPDSTVADMKLNEDLQSVMMEAVTLACKDRVKKYEIPAKVVLLTEPFSVENEMLTPKMSVKRHVVVRHYSAAIEQLYKEAPAPAAARVTRRARDDDEEDDAHEAHHTPRPLAA